MTDHDKNINDRVETPADHSDDEALKEYGRQLALDSLLKDLKPPEIVEMPDRRWSRRAWLSASAASIAGVAGLALWKFGQDHSPAPDQLVKLDARWILKAAEGAKYEIISSNHIKLLRGELRLTSKEAANLLVETPFAKATAKGTDFLIGFHQPKNSTPETEDMKSKTLTRLLVLSGTVTLATGQGSKTAQANEALVAKADLPPEKILVDANSDFAFNLYSQLSSENEGANLFFSPYSVSNAMLMVAEGARGETALEMGTVLGFPESLLRFGDDAQNIPWEMSVMRSGQSRLNELLNAESKVTPEQQKLRDQEAALMKQWGDLKTSIEEHKKNDNHDEFFQALAKEEKLVAQINEVLGKFNTLKLSIANAVWGDQTAAFKDPWKKRLAGAYGAGSVQEADFRNDPESERFRINKWVEDKTEKKIKNLFPEGTITSDTRLVLTNAVYFKGDWMTPFPEERTTDKTFTLSSGKTIETPTMVKSYDGTARYAAFQADGQLFTTPDRIPTQGKVPPTYPGPDGFAIVEMPYRGGTASMVLIAPNSPSGLPALEKTLNSSLLAECLGHLKTRDTNINLPKFKMATSYQLEKTLETMGIPTAFDSRRANFTGLSEDPLFINAVIHKAFIEVSEKGTEAAAATGMGFAAGGIPATIPFTPDFKADRPFIYLIRDNKSGAILFLGRVLDPTK